MVQEKTLAEILKELGICEHILLGKSLKQYNTSMACDVFESIIGSLYLDSNMEVAREFVLKFLIKNKENIERISEKTIDYKTKLQELLQGQGKKIEYLKENLNGVFKVAIKVDGEIVKEGKFASIKQGELSLAKEIYLNGLK